MTCSSAGQGYDCFRGCTLIVLCVESIIITESDIIFTQLFLQAIFGFHLRVWAYALATVRNSQDMFGNNILRPFCSKILKYFAFGCLITLYFWIFVSPKYSRSDISKAHTFSFAFKIPKTQDIYPGIKETIIFVKHVQCEKFQFCKHQALKILHCIVLVQKSHGHW